MELTLLVIRSNHLQACLEFYSQLGLRFEHHRHGSSPLHYSAQVGATVFELYPLQNGQTEADSSTRLGFALNNFEEVVAYFQRQEGVNVSAPRATEWGVLAVLKDPDGRRVEISPLLKRQVF